MVTNDFINECKIPANCNRYGKLVLSDGITELNQSNKIQKFTIDSSCYENGNIIGTVYCKKITANLIDSLDVSLVDEDFNAYAGVKYDNGNTEYVNLGKYKIERPNDEVLNNFTSFTAYDDLTNNIDKEYVCGIEYDDENITLSDLYADVCEQLGLTPKTLQFDNSDIPIIDNPFTNKEKNRFVLQTICKISCSFVEIDLDTNEIDLCWLSTNTNPDYTFEKGDYSVLNGGKIVYGPVNSLIIKNSSVDSENVSISDDESIELNGEHQLVISEDYILFNEELRNQAITAIWNKVNGLTYVDCELTSPYGKPFIKIGSKIRIITDDGYLDTYVLEHQFTYDGTFESVIKSPALTEQEVKTKQDISLGEKLRQTEIIVNKQEGTIKEYTSKTDDVILTEANDYKELLGKFSGYTPKSEYATLKTSVEQIQTDTYTRTDIKSILKGTFYDENNNQIVSEIVRTTSGTFDENGMTYEKTNAQTKTTINETGINTKRTSNDETILFAGYVDENNTQYSEYRGQTIVATDNIINKHYFVMPEAHSRIEKYNNGGGMFNV